ncbi:MAG TPA: RIP metalloprotease RseP [Vicinamibacteria bacterium]|nr:RIP metalloprotease RseP [Vicinamibacteria bacterium]
MAIITSLLAFVFVLGIIIFVHESGHLFTAKAFGMRVFVFSFGFGKRLFGFKWGDTDCRVSAVPLGGYVKLEGEPGDHLSEDTQSLGDGRDFVERPRWQRFLVYLAGPVMNAVLTLVVLWVLYMVGLGEPATISLPPVIGATLAGSPAEAAGLQPGDEILAVDGKRESTWGEVAYAILIRPDADVRLRIRSGGRERDLRLHSTTTAEKAGDIGVRPFSFVQLVTPGSAAEAAGMRPGDAIVRLGGTLIRSAEDVKPAVVATGTHPVTVQVYRDGRFFDLVMTPRDNGSGPMIGVQLGDKLVVQRYGPVRAVSAAGRRTGEMTVQIFEVLGRLVTGRLSPKTLAGPLGIAQQSGQAARQGAEVLWGFVAFISLNVGILNLFPVAPLDGGHLAILAVEGVARRDLSPGVKNLIVNAGAVAIFLLIGLVLYSDISKMSIVHKLLQ